MKKNSRLIRERGDLLLIFVGLFSSIVLSSLVVARAKADDAKVQAELSSMRAQAMIYQGSGNAFNNGTPGTPTACATTVGTLFSSSPSENGLGNLFPLTKSLADTACVSSLGLPSKGATWAIAWPIKDTWVCADYTGQLKNAPAGSEHYTSAGPGPSPAAVSAGKMVCN